MTSCSDNNEANTVALSEPQEDETEKIIDTIKNEPSDIKETWEYKIYKL
jgi:hypothetical protein